MSYSSKVRLKSKFTDQPEFHPVAAKEFLPISNLHLDAHPESSRKRLWNVLFIRAHELCSASLTH